MNIANKDLLSGLFPGHRFYSVDTTLMETAHAHLDDLTKPKGSLGRLEEVAARLYAIAGGKPPGVDPCILFTAAGDHGIACQGVSPFPQIVTRQMVGNFLAGGAAINVLCRLNNIDLKIVDAGCGGAPFPPHPQLLEARAGNGTNDMSTGEAMTVEACGAALKSGFSIASGYFAKGYSCLATGEMGIANSTAASALYCAFLDLEPADVAGPGAGAGPGMVQNKISVVEKTVLLHSRIIGSHDPLRILAAMGGYEIALLSGLMLACACARKPFLVDGFICTSAYVAALAFYPPLAGYAFLSHSSAEPGYRRILQKIPGKPRPLLDMDMRLGEGTGCAIALPLLRAAAAIYNDMATMSGARVSATDQDRID